MGNICSGGKSKEKGIAIPKVGQDAILREYGYEGTEKEKDYFYARRTVRGVND